MQFSVDDIQAEVDLRYTGLTLTGPDGPVTLQPYLLLDSDHRRLIRVAQESASGITAASGDEDEKDRLVDLGALAADEPARWRGYAAARSLAWVITAVQHWAEASQLPEASPSASS